MSFSLLAMCDSRTEENVEQLNQMDVIIIVGGHVPTQNAFMERIGLRERLRKYKGLIIAWSAHSTRNYLLFILVI